MRTQAQAASQSALAQLRSGAHEAAMEGRFSGALKNQKTADFLESNGETYFLRESMVQNAGLAVPVLCRPLWEFVEAAPGHYFVTTDNPVATDSLHTSLVFPVSQAVVLTYALQGKDLTRRQASPDETQKLNAYIIWNADKKVYSPRPDQWIHTVLS
jgi:hypothetical protein